MPERVRTVVHLMRHGEVDNPDGILYARLPGYHLSELGQQMAQRVAGHLAGRDIAEVIASPLERAQETAEPIAAAVGRTLQTDPRLIEAANRFEGSTVGSRPVTLLRPGNMVRMTNPWRPSWGEPYAQIATRMLAAVAAARRCARGREVVLVSHQLPIWTLRRSLERRRLWHDPRSRQCGLASLTTVTYDGDLPVGLDYVEPAADLVARATKGAGA